MTVDSLQGTIFPVRSGTVRNLRRMYRLTQAFAFAWFACGLFMAAAPLLDPAYYLYGPILALVAVLLAIFAVYSGGCQPVAFELAADALVLHTFLGKRRVRYDSITSIRCSNRHFEDGFKKRTLYLQKRLRPFPLEMRADVNDLDRLLAGLRRRVFAATGRFVGDLQGDVESVAGNVDIDTVNGDHWSLVFWTSFFSIAILMLPFGQAYDDYLHKKRIHLEGRLVPASIAYFRSIPGEFFRSHAGYDIVYKYEAENGAAYFGEFYQRKPIEEYAVGDSIDIVFLPENPRDSHLAEDSPPRDILAVFIVLLCLFAAPMAASPFVPVVIRHIRERARRHARVFTATDFEEDRHGIYGEGDSGLSESRQPPPKKRIQQPFFRQGIASVLFCMALIGCVGGFVAWECWSQWQRRENGVPIVGRVASGYGRGRKLVVGYSMDGASYEYADPSPPRSFCALEAGDVVMLRSLPGKPLTARLFNGTEQNLPLRYGGLLLFAVAAEIALGVHLRRMIHRLKTKTQ